MEVTFIDHSGFFVDLPHYQLIFDFVEGMLPPLDQNKKTIFFVSHRHQDHFSARIYDYRESSRYVLSRDITRFPKELQMIRVKPHASYQFEGVKIETLKSTDEGVAFLIEADGKKIYHAGDLHLWLWEALNPQEEEENRRMQSRYTKEIERLKKISLDLAFLVLDPRQKEYGACGMAQFLKQIDVKKVFPMHLWKQFDYQDECLLKELQPWKDKIVRIKENGERFEAEE